jgi:polyferredoxin
MRIITVRRLSQTFFLLLLLWFCLVTTLGENYWQLRGWPVNWLLQLDPLLGLGLLLATHTIFAGLLWGVLTLVLTIFFGRVFCGWVCPLGTLQQFCGYLGRRALKQAHKIQRNQPHPAQRVKYWLLLFILSAAGADLLYFFFNLAPGSPWMFWVWVSAAVLLATLAAAFGPKSLPWRRLAAGALVILAAAVVVRALDGGDWLAASLQSGLLDPLALVYRSVNLVLLPIADRPFQWVSVAPRFYHGAGLIGILFLCIVLISVRIPRFYCRFVCPTGALLGLFSRWALWRLGKRAADCAECRQCRQCEADCEGACAPTGTIRIAECVVCFNCRDQCRHRVMAYGWLASSAGEQSSPDLTRREIVTAVAAGFLAGPMVRLGAAADTDWAPRMVRPPGALDEKAFLARCVKCGQCMRICPTNVIQPAGMQSGVEGLWTPVLNFRIGTSGCQHNCVACSQICPTAALRPLSIDERMGQGIYSENGPVRIGMAFVDRGRCLPWAMDRPCIVCQENCPVSPKAIFTRKVFQSVRDGRFTLRRAEADRLTLEGGELAPGQWASGDFYCRVDPWPPRPIRDNTRSQLELGDRAAWPRQPQPGQIVEVVVGLQQPYVDPGRCIGCGVCEHECPVQGLRAIRVTAENETRAPERKMTLNSGW